jgi:hypothetical protein
MVLQTLTKMGGHEAHRDLTQVQSCGLTGWTVAKIYVLHNSALQFWITFGIWQINPNDTFLTGHHTKV